MPSIDRHSWDSLFFKGVNFTCLPPREGDQINYNMGWKYIIAVSLFSGEGFFKVIPCLSRNYFTVKTVLFV